MNSTDKIAIAHFREDHMNSIPKMLKATGRLNPLIHIFGRRGNDYGVGIFPIVLEGEVPIRILRMVCDKMFDELLCLSYSAEATMWKGDANLAGIKEGDIDAMSKDDPRIQSLKRNAKPIDILWITFETEQRTESKVYEVKKTGGSMVSVHGDLADDIKLVEMSSEFDGGHVGGRFANLFRKIKNNKQ